MISRHQRIFLVVAAVLLAINSRAYAKRGCSAFGHSCFGGHGKRFDPRGPANGLQLGPGPIAAYRLERAEGNSRAGEDGSAFVEVENFKMDGRQERSSGSTRNGRRLDPLELSLLVDQWLASRRPVHQQEFVANDD